MVRNIKNGTATTSGGEAELFDDDGSAVIVRAGADDYSSQPSGVAGDRIACGVLETYREAAEGTA